MNYLIKHEEVLPHRKNDSHPIPADYADQFSIRTNDKGNDFFVIPLNFKLFKSITPFQTRCRASVKTNNKSLHQQSLLLNDTDITSEDQEHIYTRIPKQHSSFTSDKTSHEETYSTIKTPTSTTPQDSASSINVQTHSQHHTLFTNHTIL